MKQGIHPEYKVINVHCACGNSFDTRATTNNIAVEICSACHPFFTGKQNLIDTAGRIEKYMQKYNLTDKKSNDSFWKK
jgi:large subunit ribosomal protein L31